MRGILSEDKLCFAETQFSSEELELLKGLAEPYSSSYSVPDVPSASYHWLGACASEKERVNPSELDLPFFLSQPNEDAPEEGSRPLRFWVSINVKRDRAEPAEVAQGAIQAKLRRHGGLVVTKRSQADILVVNKETEFYRTVTKEIADKGRHWQTTAEKEWVDACIRRRELLSATDVDLGLKRPRSPSIESIDSDDDIKIGRGPGRPPGRPRNEYTPADDDFLCRFLAAYYPHGSHGSRRTYQDLVSRQDAELFFTARHHTAQSWHERFKKNQATMSRRVARFKQQGIGIDLKTDVERERDRETRRRIAERKMQPDPGQSSSKNPHRTFVELDSSDDDAPLPKRPKTSTQRSTLGRARAAQGGSAARPSLETPATPERVGRSSTPTTAPATATHQELQQSEQAPVDDDPMPESAQAAAVGSTQGSALSREEVSEAVRLAPTNSEPEPLTQPAEAAGADRLDLSTRDSSGAGEAGPPHASDARSQSPDQLASTVVTHVEVVEIKDVSAQKGLGPQESAPRGEDNAGAQQPNTSAEQMTVSQPPDSAERHAARTATSQSRSRSPDTPAAIVPSQRSPSISQEAEDRPRPSQPRPSTTPRSLHTPSVRGTPTPRSGNGSPALTPSQRVEHGAAIVMSHRDMVKRNIAAYSKKYGCAPTELFTIVNALGVKGAGRGGQMYWDDVERGLRDRFGY